MTLEEEPIYRPGDDEPIYSYGGYQGGKILFSNSGGTFYHITPRKNISSIQRRGLVPSRRLGSGAERVGATWGEPWTVNRIYIVGSAEEAVDQLEISSDWQATIDGDDDLVVIELRIPPGVPIFKEEPSTDIIDSFFIENTRIRPRQIKVIG